MKRKFSHIFRRFHISYIIIDGYNLIGVSHNDLKKQREDLIASLIDYKKKKRHDITVVFDGWKTGQGNETHVKTGGIRVVYSKIGENADSVIKRIIRAEHREWIVVSSDRDIIRAVWSSGSIPISSEDFLNVLEPPGQPYVEEEIMENRAQRRKGNPRTLSKKEKAVRKALRKL